MLKEKIGLSRLNPFLRKVQCHAFDATVKFDHLTSLDVIQTIDTSDTITNRQYTTYFSYFSF